METNQISETKIYSRLEFYDGNNLLIKWQGAFIGDLLAGLIAAIKTCYHGVISDGNYIITEENGDIMRFDLDKKYGQVMYKYIVLNGIRYTATEESRRDYEFFNTKEYRWWIKSEYYPMIQKEGWTLYEFNSSEFVRGFISGCNTLGIDYLTKVNKLPYHLEAYSLTYQGMR